jgi:predicted phage tail protein
MAEIAVIEKTVKVAIVYNPFKANEIETHEIAFREGFSIADYMGDLPTTTNYVVGHMGEAYEREQWASVHLKAGDAFSLVCVPEGGGQGGGKNIFRMIALIAVMAAAAWVSGGALAGAFGSSLFAAGSTSAAIAGAFVGIAGAMLVNAIMPPAMSNFNSASGPGSSPTYGYEGAKNTSQEGIVVPVVYGTYRVGGNIVDLFTRQVGDDQFLYMRTVINDGKVKAVSDILINDEPIANFTDIETRIALGDDDGATNDWFGESVHQVSVGQKITTNWLVRTTTSPVDRLRLNVVFPSGLCFTHSDGTYTSQNVNFDIQYKPHTANDSAWTDLTSQNIINYTRLISGTKSLPGYNNTGPAPSTKPGYNYSYANTIDGLFYQGHTPTPVDVTDPETGERSTVLSVHIPSGYQSLSFEGLAHTFTANLDDISAYYNIKAAWRPSGSSGPWMIFGRDSGQIISSTKTYKGVSQFGLVYRSFNLDLTGKGDIEVIFIEGMPTQLDLTQLDGATGGFSVTDNRLVAIRREFQSGPLGTGIYDFRIRRENVETAAGQPIVDSVILNDVSEIITDNIQYVGTANISLKVKMTDQLSGIPKMTALVQGSIVKQFDEDGNVAVEDWSAWPCWAALDILMNENRGRGLDPSRIDFQAFKNWETYCIANNLKFNIVVDFNTNVWDMIQICCRVGHASLARVGTKWSIVIDQPTEATMLFNDSNIIEGTFQTDWLSLADRANEIQYTYFDEANFYQQASLRITDPLAPNTGAGLRVASITEPGVTSLEQAKFNIYRQLNENRLLQKTVIFEAPLEAIACTNGDVVSVTHTSANYGRGIGSGRLKPGNTTTTLQLDSPVVMQPGTTYKALVVHPAIKRYDVTITGSGPGMILLQPNVIGSTPLRFRRLVQGDQDVGVTDYSTGTSYDSLNVDTSAGFVNGPAQLWDTDVMDEVTITASVDTTAKTAVSVSGTPLQAAPTDYAPWMIGPVESYNQKYRVRAIEGSSIVQRKLTLTQYNEAIYFPLTTTIAASNPPVRGPVAQVSALYFEYPTTYSGNPVPVNVTFNWTAGDNNNYGGADIYLSVNGAPFSYLRSAPNTTSYQIAINDGDNFRVRVVEYDLKGFRANPAFAPVVGGTVTTSAIGLGAPTDLLLSLKDFLVTATVKAIWTASPSPVIDGYRTQYINVSQGGYIKALAGTWTVPEDSAWNDAGLSKVTNSIIAQTGVGFVVVRVRAELGRSISDWITHAFAVEAPAIPSRVTGLTLENSDGDPLGTHFKGKDAKFSWRDVATEAASLSADGADTAGMDYSWRDYEVTMLSLDGRVLRREITSTPYYEYTYEKNITDSAVIYKNGRALRAFAIEVRMRGRQGQLSDPSRLEVANPPPAKITGTVIPDGNSLSLTYDVPTDPDFAGVLVWASTTADFTPSEQTQVWSGLGQPLFLVTARVPYYVRWAGFDAFGTDALIYSDQVTATAPGLDANAIAADIFDRLDMIDGNAEGSVNARIAVEAQQRATDLLAEVAARGEAISTVTTAYQTEDGALSDRIDAVVAVANGASAGVISEQTARIDADGALGSRIDAVVAVSNGNTSSITTEITARSNADGALSGRIDAVVATANGAAASVISEATARAGADGSLSSRIDAVVATANGAAAAVTTEASARAGADNSLSSRIDAVVATAGTNAAAILTETNARVSGDSANASTISTVSSTVDNHSATLTSYGSSINGLLAKAGVSTNVNGHITGWSLNNNGASGSFIVQADYFGIADGSGNVTSPFYVTGGVTYIKNANIQNLTATNISSNSLTHDVIADNATSDNLATTTGYITGLTHLAYNTIASVTVQQVNTNSPVFITAVGNGNVSSPTGSNSHMTVAIARNGTVLSTGILFSSGTGIGDWQITFLDPSAPAGNMTYSVLYYPTDPALDNAGNPYEGSGNFYSTTCTIRALSFKGK